MIFENWDWPKFYFHESFVPDAIGSIAITIAIILLGVMVIRFLFAIGAYRYRSYQERVVDPAYDKVLGLDAEILRLTIKGGNQTKEVKDLKNQLYWAEYNHARALRHEEKWMEKNK